LGKYAKAAATEGTAVVDVTLPGHAGYGDAPVSEAEPLLAVLFEALLPLADRRPVLIGFSMGGRIAFELARRLTEAGRPCAGLVVCVSRAPHTGVGHRPLSGLNSEAFASTATGLGLMAPQLIGLPDAEPLIEALRADLAVVERMPSAPSTPLDVPAAIIGATGDWMVDEPSLRRWNDVLVDPLQLRISGSHLAWVEQPTEMSAALVRAIRHVRSDRS
jgi:surfactin synthase thioesterase subunit